MKLFKTKAKKQADRVEARFQTAVNLIKDLDKREKNRLIDGMELAWQSYDKIRQVKTNDEKEVADIDEAEKVLIKEVEKKEAK